MDVSTSQNVSGSGRSGSSHNIPKLNGRNYAMWRQMIEIVFELRGLSDVALVVSADRVRDNIAKLILYETIEESQANIVRGCTTTKEIIDRLELTYADKSAANVYRMLNEFYNTKKQASMSMSQHIGKIEDLRLALKDAGEAQSDAVFMVTLIDSLSTTHGYEDLMERWELTYPDMRKASNLVSLLLKREQDASTKSAAESMALVARGPKPNARPMTIEERKKITKCAKCNQKGHWYKECPNPPTSTNQGSREQSTHVVLVLSLGNLGPELNQEWVADSGATAHMSNSKSWFTNLIMYESPQTCAVGDGYNVEVLGVGEVKLRSIVGNTRYELTLKQVMFIPKLTTNLLSIGAATSNDLKACFTNNSCEFVKNESTIISGSKIASNLYLLAVDREPEKASFLMNRIERTSAEWHDSLGHPGLTRMKQLEANGDINIKEDKPAEGCPNCPAGKANHASHPARRERAEEVGDMVHLDLAYINKESMYTYYILAKDEASEYTFIYFLETKAKTSEAIERLTIDFEIGSQRTIRQIKSDKGSEFLNELTMKILQKNRIGHETSAEYTPQQNGTAERGVQTINKIARTMIVSAGLPAGLEPEAIRTAVYLANRLPTSSCSRSPHERFTGPKPTYGHLVPFGTPAHVFKNGDYLKKFDARTEEAFVVGYTNKRNTYRAYVPSKKRVIATADIYFAPHKIPPSRDCSCAMKEPAQVATICATEHADRPTDDIIEFATSTPIKKPPMTGADLEEFFNNYLWDENVAWAPQTVNQNTERPIANSQELNGPSHPEEQNALSPPAHNRTFDVEPSNTAATELARGSDGIETSPVRHNLNRTSDALQNENDASTAPLTRSKARIIAEAAQRPLRQAQGIMRNLSDRMPQLLLAYAEPSKYSEAMTGPEKFAWAAAIKEEIAAHETNSTWQIVDRPTGGVLLTARWVFKVKRDKFGNAERYKARIVARGYLPRFGHDYFETYAPVAKPQSIRLLLALAARKNLAIKQFDVQTAFLHGSITETIHMDAPDGLEIPANKCLLIKKALYGLKQAPRAWNSAFNSALEEIGMHRTASDPCVYTHKSITSTHMAIHVDDGIIISTEEHTCANLIAQLDSKFTTKIISGSVFLGLEITKTGEGLQIAQTRYVEDMLERFDLQYAAPAQTPLADTKSMHYTESDESPIEVPYREIIGSLLYCAMATRPDILFATIFLARFSEKPLKRHWQAAKRILLYLSGTKNVGLHYPCNPKSCPLDIRLYTDADWATDPVTRKSVSGCLLLVGECLVSYHSHRQTVVAGSTCEAEFYAADEGVRELRWTLKLLTKLRIQYDTPTLIVDNAPTIRVIRSGDMNQGLKHIEIHFKSLCEQYRNKTFEIEHTPSQTQVADLLTKQLPRVTIDRLSKIANLRTAA